MFCWTCRKPVAAFAAYGVPPRPGKCPHCGAKPRGRLLEWFLREVLRPRLPGQAVVLEVGPSRFSIDAILGNRALGAIPWTMIDLRVTRVHRKIRAPHRFAQMDATRLGFASRTFDLVLCNNVLPYVEQDQLALREISRCLKPDGLALIETHVDAGATLPVSVHRQRHPEVGEDYYAENGDQWVYGKDFFDRVAAAGLDCRLARFFEQRPREFLTENGLKSANQWLLAFIEPAALDRCLHPELRMLEAT